MLGSAQAVQLTLNKCQFDSFNSFPQCTDMANALQQVLKAAFGLNVIHNEVSYSIRKIVAKFTLLPRFVFSILAFLIEWAIRYSEN